MARLSHRFLGGRSKYRRAQIRTVRSACRRERGLRLLRGRRRRPHLSRQRACTDQSIRGCSGSDPHPSGAALANPGVSMSDSAKLPRRVGVGTDPALTGPASEIACRSTPDACLARPSGPAARSAAVNSSWMDRRGEKHPPRRQVPPPTPPAARVAARRTPAGAVTAPDCRPGRCA